MDSKKARLSGIHLAGILLGAWLVMLVIRTLVAQLLVRSPVLGARIGVGLWIVWLAAAIWMLQRWRKTAPSVPPVNH